jgi:hypothetical protein
MGDHEPNEYGFAGDPAMPQASPDEDERASDEEDAAEEVAVPDEDLTSAVEEGLADVTDDESDR